MTLFESVSLCDELVVTSSEASDEVVCSGVEGRNLVEDALAGLRARGWAAPAVRIEIAKRTPIAGGMGGGSADAAALLRIAPQLAPIPDAAVRELAAELGADVPAQLTPGLVLGTGAGEVVSLLPPFARHSLVIVPLDRRLSTAEVYAEADRLGLSRGRAELEVRLRELDESIRAGGQLEPSLLVNDLEPAAVSLCPMVGEALDAARSAGADVALVCGSGPTVAGLFWGEDAERRAEQAVHVLRDRFRAAVTVSPVSSRAFGKMDRR